MWEWVLHFFKSYKDIIDICSYFISGLVFAVPLLWRLLNKSKKSRDEALQLVKTLTEEHKDELAKHSAELSERNKERTDLNARIGRLYKRLPDCVLEEFEARSKNSQPATAKTNDAADLLFQWYEQERPLIGKLIAELARQSLDAPQNETQPDETRHFLQLAELLGAQKTDLEQIKKDLAFETLTRPDVTFEEIVSALDLNPDDPEQLNHTGGKFIDDGLYRSAELLLEKAYSLYVTQKGKEDPDTLICLNNLAICILDQGLYDEAEPLLKQALEARERTLGLEHPNTLTSLNNLATCCCHQGRYDEAEPLLKQTLEARKRVLGPEHPHMLESLYSLATCYDNKDRHKEAEPLFKQALDAQKRILSPEHPNTLQSLNNLAMCYFNQGRFDEAEPLLMQALDTRKRVLSPDHPDTLGSLNNLATCYFAQGRYDEAEPLLKQTLEACKRVLGPEHPDTLESLNSLLTFYERQNRHTEAEDLRRRFDVKPSSSNWTTPTPNMTFNISFNKDEREPDKKTA